MSRKARNSKKRHLGKAEQQTKWAPVWIIWKKFGKGKKVSIAEVTHKRRNWRRDHLKIKPRRIKKNYLG